MRLDVYLFTNDYVKSRQKAKILIEEGNITVDGAIIKKPAYDIDEANSHLIKVIDSCPYVSRGGLKLEKMLNEINVDLHNKTAIDIGSSTGGFTHCLLLNGVSLVYAVDSGSNQLHESLKNDNRVISMENFNARNLTIDFIGQRVDIVTCDVSFISQTYMISVAKELLKDDGIFIGLIKPQFEVGKGKIGKGGIVKELKYRYEAVKKVYEFASENQLKCIAFCKSPILGGDGNTEYIATFSKTGREIAFTTIKSIMNKKEE